MVIVTLLVTALIIIAFILAITSLIKWSYKKSGAKSFLKSRTKKYQDVSDNSMSSPKKGMTTNSFLENTLNKSSEFNQTKDNMLTSSKPYGDDIS